jgi:uncharacterized membrane protein YiaA
MMDKQSDRDMQTFLVIGAMLIIFGVVIYTILGAEL